MKLELRIPPLIMVGIFAGTMKLAAAALPRLSLDSTLAAVCSLGLIIGAVGFCILGVVEFKKNKTTVDPRFPDKSSSLVKSGVYSVSRNPMYVGFAMTLLSLVVYLQSPLLVVGVVLFVFYMNKYQIKPEERALETHFGDEFTDYKKQVRRWL